MHGSSRRGCRRSSATCATSSARGCSRSSLRSAPTHAGARATRARARRRRRRWPSSTSMTPDDLRACAGTRRRVARRRPRDAAAARRARVRAVARRVPARVRRHPRRPRGRLRRRTRSTALTVDPADLRRACEVQARSHLLHLREGYLETRGRADALADADRPIGGRRSPRCVDSIARLAGAGRRDDAAAAARHAERELELHRAAIADVVKLADVQRDLVGRGRAALSAVPRRRGTPRRATSTAGARRERIAGRQSRRSCVEAGVARLALRASRGGVRSRRVVDLRGALRPDRRHATISPS